MIDHVTFYVKDLVVSLRFYDAALAPLGYSRLYDYHDEGYRTVGYGRERASLWIVESQKGEKPSEHLHIALSAKSHAEVDAFHAHALVSGGSDNGAPGLRREYRSSYYAAFVLDPDGNNIEAVTGNS